MSVGRLPNFPLDAGRPLGREFAALGLCGYRDAARHVHSLPYGRNSDRSDWRLILKEGRGTCSTKHALLADLARENLRHVVLVLGVYEMDERNTPGIGTVLERHGIPCVPEAHCYLAHEGTRVDLTREGGRRRANKRFPARGGDRAPPDRRVQGQGAQGVHTPLGGGARAGPRTRLAGPGEVHRRVGRLATHRAKPEGSCGRRTSP